jgi:hypothetical protein
MYPDRSFDLNVYDEANERTIAGGGGGSLVHEPCPWNNFELQDKHVDSHPC